MFLQQHHRAALLAVLITCGIGSAQTTYRVNKSNGSLPTPMTDEVKTLVDFATFLPGDIVLIGPGDYLPFTIGSGVPSGVTFEFEIDPALPLQRPVIDAGLLLATGQSTARALAISGGHDRTLIIDGLTFQGGSSGQGAGISIDGSSPTLRNCSIVSNYATGDGGGLDVRDSLPVVGPLIENCLIASNRADESGGGAFVHGSPVEFINCRFEDNGAGLNGGGLAISTDVTEPMTGSRLDVQLERTDFIDNRAENDGGAIYFSNYVRLGLRECTLEENVADNRGGGIYTYEGSILEFDYTVFDRNSASGGTGGGLYYSDTLLVAGTNSTFVENSATEGGGTVGINQNGLPMPASFTRCLFVRNEATLFSGGGSSTDNHAVRFDTCTFEGNTANFLGGACAHGAIDSSHTFQAENTIAWNDTVGTGGAGPEKEFSFSGMAAATPTIVSITNCDWELGTTATAYFGSGCIDAAPQFATRATPVDRQPILEYCLSAGSPCIDAGAGASAGTGSTSVNGAADTGTIDIGFHYAGPVAPQRESYLFLSTTNLVPNATATLTMSTSVALPGAVRYWFMAGSITGTSPGTPWQNILIPLVYDTYTHGILNSAPPTYQNSYFEDLNGNKIAYFAPIPASGQAQIVFRNPGLLPPGSDVFHAFWIHEYYNVGTSSQYYEAKDPSNASVIVTQ